MWPEIGSNKNKQTLDSFVYGLSRITLENEAFWEGCIKTGDPAPQYVSRNLDHF